MWIKFFRGMAKASFLCRKIICIFEKHQDLLVREDKFLET